MMKGKSREVFPYIQKATLSYIMVTTLTVWKAVVPMLSVAMVSTCCPVE